MTDFFWRVGGGGALGGQGPVSPGSAGDVAPQKRKSCAQM